MDWIVILPTLGILFSLVVFSAFFSGAESAITSASRARMRALEEQGDWRAALVNKVMIQKDRLIGTILLGNNALNTLIAAIFTSLMIGLFGHVGVYYATVAITLILLIFAEVLPKTYALYYADNVARLVVPLVYVLVVIATPITAAVGWIVRMILSPFGVDLSHDSSNSDVEELRGAIALHQGEDKETNKRRAMLRSILDLEDVQVGTVMNHRKNVFMMDIHQPSDQIIQEIMETKHTRVPFWRGSPENIIGILHTKTLLDALYKADGNSDRVNVAGLLTAPWFIPDTTTLFDQLESFRDRREHFAIVVDEYGSVQGIITLEDILEEIVGHIDDEKDMVVPGVRRLPGGFFMVNGDLTLRDLNRELGWKLPVDENYSTVAGLVIHESRCVPDVGHSYHFYDFQFDVLKRHRNQITLLRVTPTGDGLSMQ